MHDVINGTEAHAKFTSQILYRLPIGPALANRKDIRRSQLRSPDGFPSTTRDSQHPVSMKQIPGARHDFEILKSVVVFDPVDMVDLQSPGQLANESSRNQPMNPYRSLHTRTAEVDPRIAKAPRRVQQPGDSSHTSEVADFVVALEADNGTPFFIHETR